MDDHNLDVQDYILGEGVSGKWKTCNKFFFLILVASF
jgi:hypothetical protein